ncbi:MAG TPA: SulP family inorganic anion transporter, partial [Usitatibacter sp.]
MRSLVPALDWLKAYEKPWLGADIAAGLTTAAIVIPKAMAYATIAGLPLQVGLYTAFVPMVIYAVLGTSRMLSVSTTTTIAILCGAELGHIAQSQPDVSLVTATATLTMMVGALLLAARVLRLGFLANFISDPVLTGFKAGIGLVIVVDQLPKLLGIHIDKSGFFRDILSIADHLPQLSTITLMVAIAAFAVIAICEKFIPRAPAPLVALGGAIAA